jgi:hypothetical protein
MGQVNTRDTLLYDFVFHYNPYRNLWAAVHRDHYTELFNGDQSHVIYSSSPTTLATLLRKYGGDVEKIKQHVH